MTTKTKSSAAAALLLLLGGCAAPPAIIDANWFMNAGHYAPGQQSDIASTEDQDGNAFAFGCAEAMPMVMVKLDGMPGSSDYARSFYVTIDGERQLGTWKSVKPTVVWMHGPPAQKLIAKLGTAQKVTVSTEDGAYGATWHVGFAPAVRALLPDCRKAFAA